MEWLLWQEHCQRNNYTEDQQECDDAMKIPHNERVYFIQHAGNGGEKAVKPPRQYSNFKDATFMGAPTVFQIVRKGIHAWTIGKCGR